MLITLPLLQFIFTTNAGQSFDSLSVPLHAILSTNFVQPTFGQNYLTFDVKPSPDGGLTDGTRVEVRFKERAMFEFVSLLEKSRERAIYMKRQLTEEEEGLRKCATVIVLYTHFTDQPFHARAATYTMPAESSSVSMVGGIPVENPPSYD